MSDCLFINNQSSNKIAASDGFVADELVVIFKIRLCNMNPNIDIRSVPVHNMSKSPVIILKTTCWFIISVYSIGSIWFHQMFLVSTRPCHVIFSGNSVTDPLSEILSIGTPISIVALAPLSIWWHRGLVAGWSIMLAWLLVLVFTTLLFVDGIRIFGSYGRHHLSEIVWWMRPVSGLFGI